MTLNNVMGATLRYFTTFDRFEGQLRHSSWSQIITVRNKKMLPKDFIFDSRPIITYGDIRRDYCK